jgi:cytochrome b6-f complex iron-sulfur subunit
VLVFKFQSFIKMMPKVLLIACLVAVATAFSPSVRLPRANAMKIKMSDTSLGGDDIRGEGSFVPDMPRRGTMNAILVGAVGVSTLGLAVPYLSFFVPNTGGANSGGVTAKDALGRDVVAEEWKSSHAPGARELVLGLKGEATYLILDDQKNLSDFALNAVCTHLGCVVPWNKAENKFICPCHGSQYNKEGKMVRGPAPLSLALAHVETTDGKVNLMPWTETDFRNGEKPWWT